MSKIITLSDESIEIINAVLNNALCAPFLLKKNEVSLKKALQELTTVTSESEPSKITGWRDFK